VAVNAPDLTAAIPFYGAQPAPEDVPKIKAAMLIHYAGNDARINAGIPAFEEALKKAGVKYTIRMHDGAEHGFMNDTGQRYDKGAAEIAWVWTVGFLAETLKS
jgi:carboxymethylenebutenolidase